MPTCFNPRPASQPDDTVDDTEYSARYYAFQSTSGITAGRHQDVASAVRLFLNVSIHVRHHSRTTQIKRRSASLSPWVSIHVRHHSRTTRAVAFGLDRVVKLVSIHVRHHSRTTRRRRRGRARYAEFQSTSGITAGRHVSQHHGQDGWGMFQSTSGITAGRHAQRGSVRCRRYTSFNPRPASQPDDTARRPSAGSAS